MGQCVRPVWGLPWENDVWAKGPKDESWWAKQRKKEIFLFPEDHQQMKDPCSHLASLAVDSTLTLPSALRADSFAAQAGHLFPILSVSDLGLGHLLHYFTHTGAGSSQDPSPAGYRDKRWQLFSSQCIRKLFFPNRILFCSQDSNSSSLRGVCVWYGQWCCAGNCF